MDEEESNQLVRAYLLEKRGGKPDPYPDNERQLGVFYNDPVSLIDCPSLIWYGYPKDEHIKAKKRHESKLDLYRWMYEQKKYTKRSIEYLEKYIN